MPETTMEYTEVTGEDRYKVSDSSNDIEILKFNPI